MSEPALAWFRARLGRREPPPLGIHLLMGPDAPQKTRNVVRNLAEDRIRVVQAVAQRAGAS